MLLGDCKFDKDAAELVNQITHEQWHLPRAELQVLSLLIKHRGQLVSKHELKTGSGEHAPLTDASVARAVFMIRSFLGPQYECLIETVKGQGYLLRQQVCHGRRSLTPAALKSIPLWAVGILFGFMFGLSAIYFVSIDHGIPTVPLVYRELAVGEHQQVKLSLYANSKTNNGMLLSLGEQFAQHVEACGQSVWDHAYLSLSHDKQILNITLKGERLGQSVVRNLKISDFRHPKLFINTVWLNEVNICG